MQIITKFITNDAVTDQKIRLRSNQYLRSRNNANSADLNILKTDASDHVIMGVANWIPNADNTFSLGSSSVRFAHLYSAELNSGTGLDLALVADGGGGNLTIFATNIIGLQGTTFTTQDNQDYGQTLTTGNNVGGPSGNTNITTGVADTAANRGLVQLGSYRVVLAEGALNLYNSATDPSAIAAAAGDLYYNTTSNEVKYYNGTTWVVLGSGGGSSTPIKENFTLSGTDITNQYIDLSQVAILDSIDFLVKGGGIQIEGGGEDYDVSYTGGAGGNTRINFQTNLATGGDSALVAGDVIVVKYVY